MSSIKYLVWEAFQSHYVTFSIISLTSVISGNKLSKQVTNRTKSLRLHRRQKKKN